MPMYWGSIGQGISDAQDASQQRTMRDLQIQEQKIALQERKDQLAAMQQLAQVEKGFDVNQFFSGQQPPPQQPQVPPQIPPQPGQPSQAMMQPGQGPRVPPPPGPGPMGGPGQMPQGMGPQPSMPGTPSIPGMPTSAPGPGGQPPQIPPQQMPPGAPPRPQGTMPMAPYMAPRPMPGQPPGPQGQPSIPAPPQAQPQPEKQEPGEMLQEKMFQPTKMLQFLISKGVRPDLAIAEVEKYNKVFGPEEKAKLELFKVQQKYYVDQQKLLERQREEEDKVKKDAVIAAERERSHKENEGARKEQADAAMLRAQKYQSGQRIPPAEDVKEMASAVAEYRLDPIRLSTKGGYRERVLEEALKINPSYDSKEYAAENAFGTSSTRAAGNAAANTAIAARAAEGGADILEQAAGKVDRGDWKRINSALLAAKGEAGIPEVGAFEAALNTFINEYSRAVNPKGTATVSDKNHAREILSTADSPETFKAKMSILRQEMVRGRQAPLDVSKDLQRARQAPPKAGTVQDGYRFKGGDPGDKSNWEKV